MPQVSDSSSPTSDKPLVLGKHVLQSRLIVGTVKYATFELMQQGRMSASTLLKITDEAAGTPPSKLGLARYYAAVADWMVPHVSDRPLSLVRCPTGERGACFYQKHAAPGVPKQVKRVRIRESGGGTASYLYVDDLPGVIALAQIGVLELHPWGTRVDRLERQVMRLSELVRAHAEDEDRLVRIVAQDHDALRRELLERDGDGGPVPGPSRLKPGRDKVGLIR